MTTGVDRCNMETSDVHKNRSQQTMTHGPNPILYLFFFLVSNVNWNTSTPICLCIFYEWFHAITAELFSCHGKE